MSVASTISMAVAGLGAALKTFGPLAGGPAGEALEGIGEGCTLVSRLIDLGIKPREAIVRIHSSMVDFDSATAAIDAYARTGQK
jgi:hypothetical protein